MRHFLTTSDWTRPELQSLMADAVVLRASPYGNALEGKTLQMEVTMNRGWSCG